MDPGSLHKDAITALKRGDHAQARQLLQQLGRLRPDFADAHFLLGMAELGAGQVVAALRPVETAVALSPNAEYLAQYARLLVSLRRDADALAAADRAAALNPDGALVLDTLGCVYSRLAAHDKAVPLFEKAARANPAHVQMRYNLASSLGFLGRFDEAAAHYERVIAAAPDFVKAHSALSMLRRQTPEANHIARLEGLLPKVSGATEELNVRYALAKEYDDLGDSAAAYQHLHAVNSRHKRRLNYDFSFDQAIFERLRQRFAEPDYFVGPGDHSRAPIFVLGMPRTGTTLVDRIISSHPEVESAGELQVMQLALKRASGSPGALALTPETIDAVATLAPARLGAAYLRGAEPFRKDRRRRFIDKLPLNVLYVGYIARALPEASVICLRRHPLDTVWSNYRHLFATHFSYYNYAYDLLDSARYYRMFDQLMAFWADRFPGRVLEVRYEHLVESQEAETRRILDHCRLGFDPRCLDFHQNEAAVATPSASAVRQPIYRGALGRWRRYADYLQAARDYLQSEGIACD